MDQTSPKMLTSMSGGGTSDKLDLLVRQFLVIPVVSSITERVFSCAGLTLSDLYKPLLEGTLETIMWSKCGTLSIPFGRGDLHITHPEL